MELKDSPQHTPGPTPTTVERPESVNNKRSLKRQMSLFSGSAVIIGVIIGSGIFISPVDMLKGTKSVGVSLLMWVIVGIISLFGALCFAELGCHIRESGALYIYIQKGMGNFWGFHLLWAAMFVMYPAANTAIAITSARNFLQLADLNCTKDLPNSSVVLLSICIIALITSINMRSVRLSNWVQNITTILKVAVLCIIIVIGMVNIVRGQTGSLKNAFVGSTEHISGEYVEAFYNGLFAYAGWYSLNFITEELVNPFKNLPRAIFISMPLIMIIYVLANVSYFTVLTAEEVANSNAVAVSFASKINKYFAYSIPFFVAASTFGSLNGVMLSVPRMYMVAARQDHLPKSFSLISSVKTPGFSVLFTGVTSCFYLFTTKTSDLIVALTFIESAAILACIGVLIKIRWTKDTPKIHGTIVYTFFVVQFFIVMAAVFYEPYLSFIGICIVATGVPFYILFIHMSKHYNTSDKIMTIVNQWFQKSFMALVEHD